MLVKTIPVTNPEECPFRYVDDETGLYYCTFEGFACDQGELTRTQVACKEVVSGVHRVTYEEKQVFTFPAAVDCPFGGKPFTVSVRQE